MVVQSKSYPPPTHRLRFIPLCNNNNNNNDFIDRESPVGLSPIFPGVLYVKTYAYIYIIYTKNDT